MHLLTILYLLLFSRLKQGFLELLVNFLAYCFALSVDLEEIRQGESLNIPAAVDHLLSDYARRFHEIKTPRKLLWKKNLGTVKVRNKAWAHFGRMFFPHLTKEE